MLNDIIRKKKTTFNLKKQDELNNISNFILFFQKKPLKELSFFPFIFPKCQISHISFNNQHERGVD